MRESQTVNAHKVVQHPGWYAAGCAVGVLVFLLFGLTAPGRATTAPTPSGMDWKCYETCRQEECTDHSLWCVATCLLACFYPPEEPDGGGSAFVDILERVTDLVIRLEEPAAPPLDDLLAPVIKSLEQYHDAIHAR